MGRMRCLKSLRGAVFGGGTTAGLTFKSDGSQGALSDRSQVCPEAAGAEEEAGERQLPGEPETAESWLCWGGRRIMSRMAADCTTG